MLLLIAIGAYLTHERAMTPITRDWVAQRDSAAVDADFIDRGSTAGDSFMERPPIPHHNKNGDSDNTEPGRFPGAVLWSE